MCTEFKVFDFECICYGFKVCALSLRCLILNAFVTASSFQGMCTEFKIFDFECI